MIPLRLMPLACLLALAGCGGDATLQGAFGKQMKLNKVDGYDIIQLDERPDLGLVLYTSWTEAYPDNRNRPGVDVFYKQNGAWEMQPGIDCSSGGTARLGLGEHGYLYCAMLKPDWDFTRVLVGGQEAQLFEFGEGQRVWYVVVADGEAQVKGVNADGREYELN